MPSSREDIPNSPAITGNPDLPPTSSYNLVNLYAGYQPTPDITWALSVENLLNVQYAPYLNAYASGNGVLPFPSPGITVKGSLAVRLGRTRYAVESCAHNQVMRQANQLAELAVQIHDAAVE